MAAGGGEGDGLDDLTDLGEELPDASADGLAGADEDADADTDWDGDAAAGEQEPASAQTLLLLLRRRRRLLRRLSRSDQ
jgi:hypothetical protein